MPDKPGLMRSKPVRGVTKLLRGEISPKAFVELAYQTAFDKPPTTRPVSYSQARQDLFFALLFGERPGTYVDVGARDGVIISNTYALEKHYGWTGVCVEPHPGSFAKLARSRGSRNINAAVADVDEGGATLDFVMWKEGPVGYAGLIDEDFRHTERMKTHAHEVIKVPCLPLHKILSDEGLTHVDVLDIDVEGAEAAVVRSIDFDKCHINVISIERVNDEIEGMLAAAGFRLLVTLGEDSVYRNEIQRSS